MEFPKASSPLRCPQTAKDDDLKTVSPRHRVAPPLTPSGTLGNFTPHFSMNRAPPVTRCFTRVGFPVLPSHPPVNKHKLCRHRKASQWKTDSGRLYPGRPASDLLHRREHSRRTCPPCPVRAGSPGARITPPAVCATHRRCERDKFFPREPEG